MEKLFKKLPLTIQQSTKTKQEIRESKGEPPFAVKKYNSKHHSKFSFYKPISKIVSEND